MWKGCSLVKKYITFSGGIRELAALSANYVRVIQKPLSSRIGLFLECCLLTLTQSESLFFFAQCNVKVNHGAFFATSPPSPPTFNHRFIIKPQPVKCLWVCGEKGLCSMMMSKIQLNVIFTHTSLSAMVGCHANSKSFHQSLAKELQTDCININSFLCSCLVKQVLPAGS